MQYVLQIVSLDGIVYDPNASRRVGQFIRVYEPAPFADESGVLEVTPDPTEAKRFPHMVAALNYWRQANGLRPDGEPNRPLTAYSVQIIPLPDHYQTSREARETA